MTTAAAAGRWWALQAAAGIMLHVGAALLTMVGGSVRRMRVHLPRSSWRVAIARAH
jgi:hypothetical protein